MKWILGRVSAAILVGPHMFGCATTSTSTWEMTRRADTLVPEERVQSTCGGNAPCAALCEDAITNQLDDPWRNLCETDQGDSFGIAGCVARGGDLLITCEVEDSKKGCIPDS